MKKYGLFLGMCLFILLLAGSALAGLDNDNILVYYGGANLTDMAGNIDVTSPGPVYDTDGVIGNAYNFSTDNSWLVMDSSTYGVQTICYWAKHQDTLTSGSHYGTNNAFLAHETTGTLINTIAYGAAFSFESNEVISITYNYTTGQSWYSDNGDIPSIAGGTFHHYCFTCLGGAMVAYINGSSIGTMLNPNAPICPLYELKWNIGRWVGESIDYRWRGTVDEIMLLNESLTATMVKQVYDNQSAGDTYPAWGGGGPPAPGGGDQVKVTVTDTYNSSAVSGANVTLLNGLSNITDAAGITTFHINGTHQYNVTHPEYFDTDSTYNATNATYGEINITGAFPTFVVYDIEGAALSGFTISSPSTTNTTAGSSLKLVLPPNDTTILEGAVAGYPNVTKSISTTSKDTGAYNISGFYQATLNVNATNAYTGTPLTNFTGWAYHNETGYNYSFNDDNGTASVNLTFGNYTVFIDAFGYSVGTDNYAYKKINQTPENVTFALYSENSIFVYIYDEDTNILINVSTTTVSITGNGTYQENTTANGTIFIENLLDGNYSFLFENVNYTNRAYDVTVADRSSQILNVYLTPAGNLVVFAVIDDSNSQTIEGVNVIMERLINGSYVPVENRDTDVTGRVQFSYSTGVLYRFTLSIVGYSTKVFELDPIIFESYIIRLERELDVDEEVGLFDVTINYFTDHHPQFFLNNDNNTLTFTFGSSGGSLESYGMKVTYPGGSNTSVGSNAIGETFLNTFPIVAAVSTDRVNLTYWYDSVFGDNKSYSVSYLIEGAADSGTLQKAGETDFGLGTLEKLLIAVIVVLLVAGLLTLVGNPVFGLAGGLLVFGFFIVIGFVSIWVAIPSFLVGVLIFIGRSSE